MDDLEQLILRLRDRIQKHSKSLRTNESETRYALINPVLSYFGWTLDDPSQVIAEWPLGRGRCDYALFSGAEEPSLIIEAKALGTDVGDGIGQSIAYCLEHGVDYFGVTNGQVWEIYETRAPGAIDKKLVVRADVQGPTNHTALNLLWLWRGNHTQGPPLTPKIAVVPQSPKRPPVPPQGKNWISVAQWSPVSYDKPPTSIRFPDGTIKQTHSWRDLQIRAVEWLVSNQKLSKEDCPLTTPRGSVLVNTSPVSSRGTKFLDARQVAGLWVETNRSATESTRQAKAILTACNIPLTDVFVDSEPT